MREQRRCAIHAFPDRLDIIVPEKQRFFRKELPERTVTFAWQEVTRVIAFKRDQFIVDLMCMAFELDGAETVEVNEDMDGWSALVEAVPIYLSRL